jgi:PHD/YefM family antitoxin component YafN of YafNO toxin-antitoxin module
MVSYTKNELLSITDLTKSLSRILSDIKTNSLEKVGVLRNNRLEAVVISTDEYERLKEIENIMEEKEFFETIKNRKETPKSDYLSLEDMAKKFDIDMNNV